MELSNILIWIPVVVAGAVMALAWTSAKPELKSPMGKLQWSFSESWASNLTALMVLFTTLFGLDLLPTDPYVSAADYSSLSVMFAGMVIVAPILFLLSAEYTKGEAQGRVWGLLLAGVVVLWAVLGQMATTFVLSLDLLRSNLHGGIAVVLVGLSGLALLSALIHGIRGAKAALEPSKPTIAADGVRRVLMP